MSIRNKYCIVVGCEFYKYYPDGCSENFNNCSFCGRDISYNNPNKDTRTTSIVTGRGSSNLFKPCPIDNSQNKSTLTISFYTVISVNSYNYYHENVTIRFKNRAVGNYLQDRVNSILIEEREFDGYTYLKLEGKLQIDKEQLINILSNKDSVRIHYKYFLNGVEEKLYHQGRDLERTVELSAGNNHFIEKYDQTPFSDSQIESYETHIPYIWRIFINLMSPNVPIREDLEPFPMIDEFFNKFRTILTNLCYSHYSEGKKYSYLLPKKDILERREELVKDWLLIQLANKIQVANYMYVFYLTFFIIGEYELVSSSHQVYKCLFEGINDEGIKRIIEGKDFLENRISENCLKKVSKTIETVLFVDIKRFVDTIRFIPLFHHVFEMLKEAKFRQSKHDFPNELYWGLPPSIGIPKYFTQIDLLTIPNYLSTFSGIDELYPYSILLLTCQKNSLSDLLKMPEFPTDSFLSLLVFRIYKNNCSSCNNIDKCIHLFNSESKSTIYTFTINKLQNETADITDRQIQIMCISIFWIWENMEKQTESNLELTLKESHELLSLTAHLLTEFEKRYEGLLTTEILKANITTIIESKSIIKVIRNVHGKYNVKEPSFSTDLFDQVKIWDQMLKYNFPIIYEWNATILSDITTLLKSYHHRILVVLLNNICQSIDLQIDARITQIIQSLLIEFLNSHDSDNCDSEYITEKLNAVPTNKKKEIFSLYSTILLRQKDSFERDSINHILIWDLWKTYLSTDLLPDEAKDVVELHEVRKQFVDFILRAENIFLDLITQLSENKIMIKTLDLIIENRIQVIILFEMQSTKHQGKHEIYRKMKIEEEIDNKSKLIKYFKKRKEDIRRLQKFIPPKLSVCEFSNFSSNSFDDMFCECAFNEEGILLPGQEISQAINSPETQIMLSTSEYLCKSEIFNHILQNLLVTSEKQIPSLYALNFYQQFWLPSFIMVEELLNSLISLKIPLSKVEEYFIDYKERKDLALTEFSNIASAVKLVSNKAITACQITPGLNKVTDYFKLRNAFEIGPIIIDIQKEYGFEGDFSEVVSLIETNPQLRDKKLESINDPLLKLAELLIKFSEQEKEILKALLIHKDFIQWVCNTFKDRNELKVFTDLVHTFCIDQPIQTETNTKLYGMCLDLAPLIFDLDRQSDNSEIFLTTCKKVFESMNVVDFLETIGATTFNLWIQMKDIHSSTPHGVREELKVLMSGSIVLNLEPRKGLDKIVSINFNGKDLDFIKELDSRITFLKDDDKANCSLFRCLLKSIISLSLFVKSLHFSGHINYRQYFLELPCDGHSLKELNKLIQEADDSLKLWTEQLNEARMNYYYLNYYTPSQIVSLQIELYKFQSSGKLDTKQTNLLSIIKQDVIEDEIISCMEKAGCPISEYLYSKGKLFSNVDLEYELCKIIETVPMKEGKFLPMCDFPADFTLIEKELCEEISKTGIRVGIVIKHVEHLKRNKKEIIRAQVLMSCVDDDNTEPELTIAKPKIKGPFLRLKNLGRFLHYLKECNYEILKVSHELPSTFHNNTPNLICVPSNKIMHTLLSLYLGPEGTHSLPYHNEILLCSSETTSEEVDMFWRRALFDPNTNHLYCLVYIEKLIYQVAVKSVSRLNWYLKTYSQINTKLVLLYTERLEYSSFMEISLQHCRRDLPTNLIGIKHIQEALFKKFSYKGNRKLSISQSSLTPAYNADPAQSYIRLVVSTTVGAGKSLAIQRLVSDLESFQEDNWNSDHYNIISIHGDRANENEILERLRGIKNSKDGQVYHFDVASSVRGELVPFLFKLLILGVISDFSGNIWCCNRKNYYVVELLFIRELAEVNEFVTLFPIIFCHQPGAFVQQNTSFGKCDRMIDKQFMKSPRYQRAFAYLERKEKNKSLDNFQYVVKSEPTYGHKEFLKTLLCNCGVDNPSWSELNHFITFFSNQMSACDNSDFYQSMSDEKGWGGFKSFIVKYMISMSRDFATSSISKDSFSNSNEINYSVLSRERWEQQPHPYIFFNQDLHSMTFLGFNIKNGNHIDIKDPKRIIEHNVVSMELEQMLRSNRLSLNIPYEVSKEDWITKLQAVIGFSQFNDPDEHYVLTLDNVMKILAIHMRFRCNIPVIIMGETGCGKTKLVQYMSLLQMNTKCKSDEANRQNEIINMIILKMHGGTTMDDVVNKLTSAIELAEQNSKRSKEFDTILFFDEANTSSSIGLIKEILCDRRYNGKAIPSDIRLQFVATCNPYRKHTPEMIKKLDSAGLGHFKHHLQREEKFGGIPLRELVYRVMEIPPSLFPLVWDFGQLSPDIEHKYIQQIVRKHLHNSHVESYTQYHAPITDVLAATQEYLRTREDECSFVSLRDIGRCMRVMLWFYKQLEIFEIEDSSFDKTTYSLILAIGVCYRAKLIDRKQFDIHLSQNIKKPLNTINDAIVISREIVKFQTIITDHMTIDKHIAKNAALKENIFMMFVCIELRIPLFLIGKPGSSKSLAKSIIRQSMEGQSYRSDSKLRNFKEVYMVSYQCSQLSTSEGIRKVFTACEGIQKGKVDKIVACAVLDEIGLAENCPNLSLKLLHSLLEEPSDSGDCSVAGNNVAFLGISNWALDPAKMNRGIMVSLQDPTEDELTESAYAICQSNLGQNVIDSNRIRPHIPDLARGYLEVCEIQTKHKELSSDYFGLRDFYGLVKMICYLCTKNKTELNNKILLHAVARNFGGLTDIDSFEIFRNKLQLDNDNVVGPSSNWEDLIKANLHCTEDSLFGSTRFLLLLTENIIALNIIVESDLLPKDAKLIFGSPFGDSNDNTVICKHIQEIKNCMETGRTLVLLNLSYLYESLYDTLNQYFLRALGRRWVDIGLGTNRMKCPVDVNFKLIVIADRKEVYRQFPSPLINRFEKHTLTMSTVLSNEDRRLVKMLTKWAASFSKTEKTELGKNEYLEGDSFIGFQTETPSLIVYSVINQQNDFEKDENYQQNVLEECKLKLLKMATPDSILRLLHTSLKDQYESIRGKYMGFHNLNLVDYVRTLPTRIQTKSEGYKYNYSLNIVTTHSPLLTEEECREIEKLSNIQKEHIYKLFQLNILQFQSEEQFVKTIKELILMPKESASITILIIQCQNGDTYADYILYAMHKIKEELFHARNKLQSHLCSVFIIQLPRITHGTSYSSFYGSKWDTIHVDELRRTEEGISINELCELSIANLFCREQTNASFSLSILRRCLQAAVFESSGIARDKSILKGRIKSFSSFLEEENHEHHLSLLLLLSKIFLQLKSTTYTDRFAESVAFNEHALQLAGTYHQALLNQISEFVIPVLAGVISYLDTNQNLKLYKNLLLHGKEIPTQTLWSSILIDKDNIFNHTEGILSSLPDGTEEAYYSTETSHFQSLFPFSWLIIPYITDLMTTWISNPEQSIVDFEVCFNDTDIAKVITPIILQQKNFLIIYYYLEDFISFNLKSPHESSLTESESSIYKIMLTVEASRIRKSLRARKEIEYFIYRSELTESLKNLPDLTIPNFHVAYENLKNKLSFIKQAFNAGFVIKPEAENIISKMRKLSEATESPETIEPLDAFVFRTIIEDCKLDLDITQATQREWTEKVRQFQHLIDNNWNIVFPKLEDQLKLRRIWNGITAIDIFIRNLSLKFPLKSVQQAVVRMPMIVLDEDTDFYSRTTFGNMFKILMTMIKESSREISKSYQLKCLVCENAPIDPVLTENSDVKCRTCIIAREEILSEIDSDRLTTFLKIDEQKFMDLQREQKLLIKSMFKCLVDVVSNISFCASTPLSDEENFIDLLFEYITLNPALYQDLSDKDIILFKDGILIPSLQFRTFILQVLLKERFEVVQNRMSDFIHLIVTKYESQDLDVTAVIILFVNCLEDSYYSKLYKLSTVKDRIDLCTAEIETISKDYDIISSDNILDSVAKMKFIAYFVSTLIIWCYDLRMDYMRQFLKCTTRNVAKPNFAIQFEIQKFISKFKSLSGEFSEKLTLYLFKCIFYQLGWAGITSLLNTMGLIWILPADYRRAELYNLHFDLFSVLLPEYMTYRGMLETHLCTARKLSQIKRSKDEEKIEEKIVYSIFKEVYIKGLPDVDQEINIREREKVNEFAKNILHQSYQNMKPFINQALSGNKFLNGIFHDLLLDKSTSVTTHIIVEILCHLFVLVGHTYEDPILNNFLSPLILIYLNPNKLCDRPFPGMMHAQEKLKGHTLGNPFERQADPPTVREISAATVSIIRAIIHGIFILSASMTNLYTPTNLTRLTANFDNFSLSHFYTLHLFRDITDLSVSTGKYFEEASIIIHLVIDAIIHCKPLEESLFKDTTSTNFPKYWELMFDKLFITPILSKINSKVQNHVSLIRKIRKTEENPVLRILFERDVDVTDISSIIWCYRSVIDSRHFTNTLFSRGLQKEANHPFLAKFFKNRSVLSATRYLPDLVKLMMKLSHKKYIQIIKRDGTQLTIKHFAENIRLELGKFESEELENLIASYRSAWNIVGRFFTQDERFKDRGMSGEISLDCLVPTKNIEEPIIMAIANILINTHNAIVDASTDTYSLKRSLSGAAKESVPLTMITESHMIYCEDELDSLVLSYACYSLKPGLGAKISYNYGAIERRIVDKFIRSKLTIVSEKIYSIRRQELMINILKKVEKKIPQSKIEKTVKDDIYKSLPTPEKVSYVLEHVVVAIKFIASLGGEADMMIYTYLHSTLKYPLSVRIFSSAISHSCCLKHIVHLWNILSVLKAKLLVANNQYPFESLPQYFYLSMTPEQEKHVRSNLPSSNTEYTLDIIHDYIVSYMKLLSEEQAKSSFLQSFSDFAKETNITIPDGFKGNIFKQNISVCNTVSLWSFLAREASNVQEL